ncbi:hypothetical protein BT69DRAFT_1289010 [Atractiella rhizophila]|nr:hypothetical protein BT69DRAFT_1289010 [Atractiella rhizophila]
MGASFKRITSCCLRERARFLSRLRLRLGVLRRFMFNTCIIMASNVEVLLNALLGDQS